LYGHTLPYTKSSITKTPLLGIIGVVMVRIWGLVRYFYDGVFGIFHFGIWYNEELIIKDKFTVVDLCQF